MDTAIITLTATAAVIVVALYALSLCRPRASHDDAEPVVGVQRHGRMYYVPRSILEEREARGAWLLSARWRAVTLAVLGGSLLLVSFLRLA
ncbi:MAG TPA: hypothetical protein PKA95_17585 [Thermomicrobiales bacterium]|nr:hypothetical protein [Thermomicrobiales bacterium]